MGSRLRVLLCACAVLPIGFGCARGPTGIDPSAASRAGEIRQNIQLMLSFDTNKDGSVSREELEAGLKQQFEIADADRNGRLSLSEMQAENGRRWQTYGTASSPLIDWNLDGMVSFAEFSGTAHSVFAQLDRDRGGTLAGAELEAPTVRTNARPARGGGPQGPQGEQRPDRTFRDL